MCDCDCEIPKTTGDRIKECKLEINKLISEDQGLYRKYVKKIQECPDDEQNLRLEYLDSRSAISHDIRIYKAELESLTQK